MNNENYRVPKATFAERPDAYELNIFLPGIGKDETDLHLEERTLTLKTRAAFAPPAGFRPAVTEFTRANYAMSFDLPEMADAAKLAARLENGILNVTLPKKPETQARKIAIG
jgi:HSP20 family protein